MNKVKTCGENRGILTKPLHIAVHEQVALDHAVVELALLGGGPSEGAFELRMAAEHQRPPALRQ